MCILYTNTLMKLDSANEYIKIEADILAVYYKINPANALVHDLVTSCSLFLSPLYLLVLSSFERYPYKCHSTLHHERAPWYYPGLHKDYFSRHGFTHLSSYRQRSQGQPELVFRYVFRPVSHIKAAYNHIETGTAFIYSYSRIHLEV